jgi:hypothetical protein
MARVRLSANDVKLGNMPLIKRSNRASLAIRACSALQVKATAQFVSQEPTLS